MLQDRGLELEKAYLEHLRTQGRRISEPDPDDRLGVQRTIAAMRDSADVIYQATLKYGRRDGRADFLQRVDKPSGLGPWSYEVLDAKLARDTRAGTILQLCLYSHMVSEIQGNLGRVAKLVEIGRREVQGGMVGWIRRRGQGRWVSGRGLANRRPGAW